MRVVAAKRQDLGLDNPLSVIIGGNGNGHGDDGKKPGKTDAGIGGLLTIPPVFSDLFPTDESTTATSTATSLDLSSNLSSNSSTLITSTSTTTTTSQTPSPSLTPPPSIATAFVTRTAEPSPSTSASAAPASSRQSFLENKPLAGSVFGIIGAVVLILLFILVTWTIRRSRRNNLESLSFDPDLTSDAYVGVAPDTGHQSWAEKRSIGGAGDSNLGHDMYYENAMYPNYGPSQYPVLPEHDISYTQQAYGHQQQHQQQGWGQQSPYPPVMPTYGPTSQSQAAYAPPLPQSSSQQVPRSLMPAVSIPYVKDALPPLPVGPGAPSSDQSDASHGSPSVLGSNATHGESSTGHSRIPTAAPLPDSFGSDLDSSRDSVELDAQFWSRTLKIANE